MDAELRQRDACPVAALRRRERAGELTRSQIELLAYAGHEAARTLLGAYIRHGVVLPPPHTWAGVAHMSFHRWLRGLERWDGALLRAERAVDALAWPKDSMRRNLEPWPEGLVSLCEEVVAGHAGELDAMPISEDATREAICAALIEWALGGES